MLEPLIHHIANIAWVVLICLTSIGIGRLMLCRAIGSFGDLGESIIFSAAIGFAVFGYSLLMLGLCQMLYPSVIYAFTALCCILAGTGWRLDKKTRLASFLLKPHQTLPARDRTNSIINVTSLSLLAVSLMACFLLVLTPSVGKDALIYHLGVPKLFLKHHGIYFIPGNVFANYPLFGEMLYIWGLSVSGEVTAKGIHYTMALLILFSMWKFSGRYLPDNRFAPLSLLIFLTIPSVFQNAHVAYCDLMLAFYAFVAMYAFINWVHTKEAVWIILCGVFSGIAMSIKFGGLFLPFAGTVGVLWGCRRLKLRNKESIRLLGLYALFVFIAGAPFYIRTWIMTGNPLYPLFYNIFGGRGWSMDQARYYDYFIRNLGMGREVIDYLLLPWNLSFRARMNSPMFDGLIGPVFLFVLPFAIGVRRIAIELKILYVYCLLAFVFWASSAQQVRYLIPLFPFLALVVGHTYSYYRNNRFFFAMLTISIAAGLTFNVSHIVRDFKAIKPLAVLTGQEDRNAFLSRQIPSYEMLQYVNTQLPENSYVLTIYMKHLAYLFNRSFYSDSMFESYTIETILNDSKTPKDVYHALKEKRFTHILYDINYIFGDLATLSENNKRLFLEFQKRHLKLVNSEKGRYFLYQVVDA